jgi:hypothetical protein
MDPVDRNMRLNRQPAAVLAGGERSVIVVTSAALLGLFCMEGATLLRAVSPEFRDVIATFTWNDDITEILDVTRWLVCFPNARAANFYEATVPAKAFVRLRDVAKLDLSYACFPKAAFVAEHYPRLTSLTVREEGGHASGGSEENSSLTDEAWQLSIVSAHS